MECFAVLHRTRPALLLGSSELHQKDGSAPEGFFMMAELPEHVRRNRAHWDQLAPQYVTAGEHGWAVNQPNWGIWSVPESEVRMFPDDIAGADAIELGCGTAYVSSCSRVAAHAWSELTIPSNNSRRLYVFSTSMVSTFCLFTVTRSLFPTRMEALISLFQNMALVFGPTLIGGCLRRHGY